MGRRRSPEKRTETQITPAQRHRAYAAYTAFAEHLLQSLRDRPLGEDLRMRMTRLYWQQTVEDASAIGLLMHRRLVGSARTLVRPQFESLVRGAWVARCADESALAPLLAYRQPFSSLAKAAAALTALPDPYRVCDGPVPFHVLMARSKDAMHDLTHRGTRALARRSNANAGGVSGIDDGELSLFHLGASLGGIAAATLLEGIDDRPSAHDVLDARARAASAWGGLPEPDAAALEALARVPPNTPCVPPS